MAAQSNSLDALKQPTFFRLWASSVFSNTGGMIQTVGAAWTMTLLTPSPGMVALVQASNALPLTLFAFLAGVLADGYDRRRIMLFSQSFMLVVSAVLAGLAFAGLLSPWMLLGFTFLIGVGMALHNPSWQSSYSDILPREMLPSAIAVNAMGMNMTRSVGPAIGGFIVGAFGAAMAFTINAVTYVAFIWALLLWRPDLGPKRFPPERFGTSVSTGLRYFFLSPHLLNISFRSFLFGFAGVAMQALMPLVARDRLHGDAFTYGVLLGAFGLGAVLGALGAGRLRARFANETIVRLGFAIFALATVIVALSTDAALTILAMLAAGACWINVISLLNASVQMATPRWVLGRMISLYMTSIFGGMALGSWFWGYVTQVSSLHVAQFVSAATLILGVGWGFRFPLQPFGDRNLDPLDRFNAPALKLDLVKRSGPIQIMIEYEIAQSDVIEFLAAMRERRRSRIRDGARRWSLLRDLERPGLWVESYLLPTWTDYIRFNARHTVADDEVSQKLRALDRSAKRKVHRMIERNTVVPLDDMPLIVSPPEAIQ